MFIRVIDWGYCQSCWFFDPDLWAVAPPTFSLVQLCPPLSGMGFWASGPASKSLYMSIVYNMFFLQHFALPSMSLIFLRALRSLANDRARDLFHHPKASPEWDDRWAAHPRHRSQPAHDNDDDFPTTPHLRRRYLRAFLAWDGRREKLAQDIYNQIF